MSKGYRTKILIWECLQHLLWFPVDISVTTGSSKLIAIGHKPSVFFNCRERGKKINSNFSLQSLIQELTSVKSTSFSISPKELKAGTQSGTGLFIAASFTIAKRWQQPACALAGDWTELMRCLPQGDRIQSCRRRECRPVLQDA